MEVELKEMQKKYKDVILKYSEEKENFTKAMEEWKLKDFFTANDINENLNIKKFDIDNPQCICGHSIHNIYVIENVKNGKLLANGEDCINKLKCNEKLKNEVNIFKKIFNKIKKFDDEDLNIKFEKEIKKEEKKIKEKKETLFKEETNKNDNFLNKCKIKIVPFGKFKGKPYIKMDKGYLKWYSMQLKENYNTFENPLITGLYKLHFNKNLEIKKEPDCEYCNDKKIIKGSDCWYCVKGGFLN